MSPEEKILQDCAAVVYQACEQCLEELANLPVSANIRQGLLTMVAQKAMGHVSALTPVGGQE